MHFKKNWLNWRSIILDDDSLSHGAKSMALYLNTFMNDSHDMAFPSLTRIEYQMALSRKTAIKHLDELEAAGYIEKGKHLSTSTNQYHNSYTALIPNKIQELINLSTDLSTGSGEFPPPDEEVVEFLPEGSGIFDQKVVENFHPNKQRNNQRNNQSLMNGAKRLFLTKDNDKMKDFAIRNGLSEPRSGEGWLEYRNRLQGEIDKINRENGFE